MNRRKNIRRVFLIAAFSLIVYLILSISISVETTFNDDLHMIIPSSLFIADDDKYVFDNLDIFKLHMDSLKNSQLSYHVNLLTRNTDIYGYVEIWQTDEVLSICLEKSKAEFDRELSDFSETFPHGDAKLRQWQYSVKNDNNIEYRVKQYFSRKADNIVAISLFVPASEWSAKYDDLFEDLKWSVKF